MGGQDSIPDNFLVVVNIINEKVQRLNPLLEAEFNSLPFLGRDDSRNKIEWQSLFHAGALAVNIESNPHLHQRPIRGFLSSDQFSVWKRFQVAVQVAHR